jgi:TonB family protein
MFGDVVEPSIKVGSKKWYTVPLSIVLHTALLAAVVIIPLMAADVLPTPPSMMAFVAAPPPPPPPPPPPQPVRVGGNIKPPMKTKDVRPTYPPIAQSARVQGVVIIEATIGPNGKVQDARVLRSIPLLDASALDAVRQWEFTPTLLNGVPVPVIMTVTVQFTLS